MQCNYLKYNYLIFRTPLQRYNRKEMRHFDRNGYVRLERRRGAINKVRFVYLLSRTLVRGTSIYKSCGCCIGIIRIISCEIIRSARSRIRPTSISRAPSRTVIRKLTICNELCCRGSSFGCCGRRRSKQANRISGSKRRGGIISHIFRYGRINRQYNFRIVVRT